MAADELLEWASKRPAWQQEALRRLAEHGRLSNQDLDEFQVLIEYSNGFPADKVVKPQPVREEHLRRGAPKEPTTILGSIGPLKNVDRLAAGQNPLRFAVDGITLVYGANGSGKSGYCRIAKRLCRSLHEAKLRGNVYEAKKAGPPEVNVTFKVGGEAHKREIVWLDTDEPPHELERISVFDSHAAGLYVDGDRKIEFLPSELDVLNKLAVVCQMIEERFQARENSLRAAVKAPLPVGYTAGTDAFAALQKLTTSTSLGELPTEARLRSLAAWSPADEERLNQLADDLKNDPDTLARTRRQAKSTLETLVSEIADLVKALSDAAVEDLKANRNDAEAKRALAAATARELFKDEPVKGIGSDSWRQMLRYAREFAAEAYAGRDPPQLSAGERCVLCQQELQPDARERLARFDKYLSDRANQAAEVAKAAFEEAAMSILGLAIRKKSDVQTLLGPFALLSEQRKKLASAIDALFEAVRGRHAAVSNAIRAKDYGKLEVLEPLPASLEDLMKAEVPRLQAEAEQYEKLKQKDDEKGKLRLEYAKLSDRKKLSTEIETVVERRNNLADLKRVLACTVSCSTKAITQQISKLRREILTPSLKKSLQAEIDAFDLSHLPLKLQDRGERGESKVQIGLDASERIERNSDILSDGEQRALALAGFLAELGEIGSRHGIIVDDPVSSLDHTRLEAVAKRLVQEAASGRQVIIFTHNLTFHAAVISEARLARVPVREEWIAKQGDKIFGVIDDAQRPWPAMNVGQRIEKIAGFIASMTATYDHADEKRRESVRTVYTMMRETWERIIEELLFAGVVERFRPEVLTQKLRAAHVDEEDYRAVFEGMTRCSRYSGHDQSKEAPPSLPKLEAIKAEFEKLREYASRARSRYKRLSEKGQALEKVPPVAQVL